MSGSDAAVEWLTIDGDPGVWRSIGLTVSSDGLVPLIGTSIRIAATDDGDAGLVGWSLSGAGQGPSTEIDGLRTEHVESQSPTFAAHALGATALDHVVVLTNDLERTSAAITM